MGSFLERLERNDLPGVVIQAFVSWCIKEQALPAVQFVLEKVQFPAGVDDLASIVDMEALFIWSQCTRETLADLRGQLAPLHVSAAEAVTFECGNMTQAAGANNWDPEAVAFFSARITSWAGWAANDFSQPRDKVQAEQQARQDQEACLQALCQQFEQF